MKRREFLKQTGAGALLLGAGAFPFQAMASGRPYEKLTILHTNDLHGRFGPGSADPGGWSSLIAQIRGEEPHVLLFDSGDIFGKATEGEIQAMSSLGYDAAILGDEDFEQGFESLSQQFKYANFPFLLSNYDLSNTVLHGKTESYRVFTRGNVRIGVFGLGHGLNKLNSSSLNDQIQILDPLETANRVAELLRQEEGCHFVICLSHLGFQYPENKLSDVEIARNSRHIDLILGGHTHTFMDSPEICQNADNQNVIINHAGWGGLLLGRLDVHIDVSDAPHYARQENLTVGASLLS